MFLGGRRFSAKASPSYLQFVQKSRLEPATLLFGLVLVTGFPLSPWAMHGARLTRDVRADPTPSRQEGPSVTTVTNTNGLSRTRAPRGRSQPLFKPARPETGRCQQNSCSHRHSHQYHTTSTWGCCEIQLSHPTWLEISQPSGCRNSLGV